MPTTEEKIKNLEEEISTTPYNKATQHHIGRLKAKLSQLKEDLIKKKSRKSGGTGFAVRKTGDASIVLIGFPSAGKSTLLNKLTDANSKVGSYEFTTLDVIPGLMNYRGANIQVLDLPGIINESHLGKGRGREIMSIVRTTDLVLILLDVNKPDHIKTIKKELYEAGLRINKEKPRVRIRKTRKGGVVITSSTDLKKLSERTIKNILDTCGIHSAEVTFHEDVDDNELIDVIMGNRTYIPSVTAINKIDSVEEKQLEAVKELVGGGAILLSASEGTNLGKLKEEIFIKLGLIRAYMKPHGGETDYSEPLILKRGATIRDVCRKIHRDFERKFKYARIWGKTVKFGGQKKGFDYVVDDGDVVSLIFNR